MRSRKLLLVCVLLFLSVDDTLSALSATTATPTGGDLINPQRDALLQRLSQLESSLNEIQQQNNLELQKTDEPDFRDWYLGIFGTLPKDLKKDFIEGQFLAGPHAEGSISTARYWVWFFRAMLAIAVFFGMFFGFVTQYKVRAVFPAFKSIQSLQQNVFLFLLGFFGVGLSLAVQILGLTNQSSYNKWRSAFFVVALFLPLAFIGLWFFSKGEFEVKKEEGMIKSKDDEILTLFNGNDNERMYNRLVQSSKAPLEKIKRVCSPADGEVVSMAKIGTIVKKGDVIAVIKNTHRPQWRGFFSMYKKLEKILPSFLDNSKHGFYCGVGYAYKYRQTKEQAKNEEIEVVWQGEDIELVWVDRSQKVRLGTGLMFLTNDESMEKSVQTLSSFDMKRFSMEMSISERDIGWEMYETGTAMTPGQFVMWAMLLGMVGAIVTVAGMFYLGKAFGLSHCVWDMTLPHCESFRAEFEKSNVQQVTTDATLRVLNTTQM